MSSKIEIERRDKKNLFISATVYLEDRDEYFLTRNLSPVGFKKGNQFDQFWKDRCQMYVELILRTLYNYRVPAGATFNIATCIKTGKRSVVRQRGGRRVNVRVGMVYRQFKLHVKFARPDDMQDDVDFDQYNQTDVNGQYVRIDDPAATPYE